MFIAQRGYLQWGGCNFVSTVYSGLWATNVRGAKISNFGGTRQESRNLTPTEAVQSKVQTILQQQQKLV